MKSEIIIPLIGVLIGWSLNEISQLLKFKRKEKKINSNTIFVLNDIIFNLKSKRSVLLAAEKLCEYPEESKEIIKELYRDKLVSTSEYASRINDCIYNISHIDPDLALNIKRYTEGIDAFKEFFNNTDSDEETKQKISYKLKMLNLWIATLECLADKLIFRYSLTMYVKMKLRQKLKSKKINEDEFYNVETLKNFIEIKKIEKTRNMHNQSLTADSGNSPAAG